MEQGKRLRLRYGIAERAERLLDRAVEAAEETGPSELKPGQVKALLRQARSGNGVEDLRNWLRYQSARVKAWQDSGLAERVLDDTVALKGEAQTLTRAIHPEEVEDWLGPIWLALVQRYLVYLHYKFMALNKEGGSDDEA
jgi:uncharacterized protein HemY